MSIYINLDENQFFSGIRLPLAMNFNSPIDAGIFWEKVKEIIPDIAFIEEKSKAGNSHYIFYVGKGNEDDILTIKDMVYEEG